MADGNIQLNPDGSGKKLDTRTESTNNEHRQVMVLGDPSTNSGVAPVDGTKGLAVDLTATGANTTALKVDGSAVTQPVSGTFYQATQPVSASALPLPTGASTSANQTTGNSSLATIATNTGNIPASPATAGNQTTANTSLGNIDTSTAAVNTVLGAKTDAKSTATDTTSVSGIALLKQISASVQAPPTQSATNFPTTVDTNSGSKSASTLRVVLATDQPALTNKLLVTPDANSSVNVSQMNGVTTAMGTGASSTGTQRVVQANDGGKTIVSTGGSASSSGNNTLVAAGTNKLKVFAFSLTTTSTTAVTCIFQSGASGTELWRVVLQAVSGSSTGANLAVALPGYLFATATATLLNLNLSGAQTVHWSVSYIDEA